MLHVMRVRSISPRKFGSTVFPCMLLVVLLPGIGPGHSGTIGSQELVNILQSVLCEALFDQN